MPHQLGDAQVGVRSVRERDWRVWKGEGDMQGWEQARVQGAGPRTSMVRGAVRSARSAPAKVLDLRAPRPLPGFSAACCAQNHAWWRPSTALAAAQQHGRQGPPHPTPTPG